MNRLKETILILIMLILVSLIIGCVGNQPISGIYGKYVSKDNTDTPNIELKNDGTFTWTADSGVGTYGTYDVEGDTINFKLSVGQLFRGKIQGNTIIVDIGKNYTFVKQ